MYTICILFGLLLGFLVGLMCGHNVAFKSFIEVSNDAQAKLLQAMKEKARLNRESK